MRKMYLTIFMLLVTYTCFGQVNRKIKPLNPTGTYKLVSQSKIKNGEVYEYTGEVRVKLLNSTRIVISLHANKGYPSYNSASFIDTIAYSDNKAVYRTDIDTSCKITFLFSYRGVNVNEEAEDYNSGGGFGHAVVATGFYRRVSSKTPFIKDISEE